MTEGIRERLAALKRQFGNYELTDDDYYESDDVAGIDTDAMFQYFRNELDQAEESRLLEYVKESKLFLHDLIGIGETLLAEVEESPATVPLSWADFSGLQSQDVAARQVTLAHSGGLKLNIAPPQVLAADSGDLDVTCELPFGAEANVFKDGDQLVVKVTSKDPALDGQLVGYCLSGTVLDQLGFILLRSGLLGTVAGMARLDRSACSGKQILNFRIVNASDLCNADLPLLEKAVANDLEDQRSIKAWNRWIDSVSSSEDGPGLAQSLERLKSQLP